MGAFNPIFNGVSSENYTYPRKLHLPHKRILNKQNK